MSDCGHEDVGGLDLLEKYESAIHARECDGGTVLTISDKFSVFE